MKKIILFSSVALLTACSSVNIKHNDETRLAEIKQICVRDNYERRMPQLAQELVLSLQKHGIAAETRTAKDDFSGCQYILNGNVRGNNQGLIKRGKFTIVDNTSDQRKPLTTVAYFQRNDEKALAAEKGLSGQTDRVVQLLLGKVKE